MIADEVLLAWEELKCGYDYYEVIPDMLIVGKTSGGIAPCAGVATRDDSR